MWIGVNQKKKKKGGGESIHEIGREYKYPPPSPMNGKRLPMAEDLVVGTKVKIMLWLI